MPARERRPGYRAVELPAPITAALQETFASLDSLSDAEQVRLLSELMNGLDQQTARLAQLRTEAIVRLRAESLTYQEIAQATGLSVPRIAQLARAAKAGGRARER